MSNKGQTVLKNLAVTMTAEPVFGRALTLAECAAEMGRMSLGSVVALLVYFKHVNEEVLLDGDVALEVREHYTEKVVRMLLTSPLVDKAMKDVNHDPDFRPLSDQAILATVELAIECSQRNEGGPLDQEQLLALGHVLLSFQSALFSEAFTELSENVTTFEALGEEAQAEFVRNCLAHNVGIYTRHAIGRFYAFCEIDEVKASVLAKTKRTLENWFQEAFDLTPTEYLCCAFMSGSPACRLNPENEKQWAAKYREDTHWNAVPEPYRSKVRSLLALAIKEAEAPAGAPERTLTSFLYGARRFHAHPMLKIGEYTYCVSPEMTLRKFLFGLPYLLQQATELRLGRALTDNEVRRSREAVGHLFEGYARWFLKRLLASSKGVEVLHGVTYGTKDQPHEIDLVILWSDIAIVLELKATVTSLGFRQTGRFAELDRMLKKGATQAYEGGHVVRQGRAKRQDGTQINDVRWVVPCVLTYDEIPLFEPISVFYEKHLTKETNLPLFGAKDNVEPVQFFDVSFMESWEESFDLSPLSRALPGYLIQRARRNDLRYRKVQAGITSGPTPGSPKPFNEVVEASKEFIDKLSRRWLKKSALEEAQLKP